MSDRKWLLFVKFCNWYFAFLEYNNYGGSGAGYGNSPNFSVPPPNFQNSSSGYASENQSDSYNQSQSGGNILPKYFNFTLVLVTSINISLQKFVRNVTKLLRTHARTEFLNILQFIIEVNTTIYYEFDIMWVNQKWWYIAKPYMQYYANIVYFYSIV